MTQEKTAAKTIVPSITLERARIYIAGGFCLFLVLVVILFIKTALPQQIFAGEDNAAGRPTASDATASDFLYSFGGPLYGAQKGHILSFDMLKQDLLVRALSDKAAADKEQHKNDHQGNHDKDGDPAQKPDPASGGKGGTIAANTGNAGNAGETTVKEPDTKVVGSADPTTVEEADARGFLILVNKTHPVDQNNAPDDLTSIKYYAKDRSASGRYMRAEAAGKFNKMVEAAKKDGLTIVMTTAYRSYSFQKTLWDSYVANEGEAAAARFSAKPGMSEHQTGLAVDISAPSVNYSLTDKFENTKEGRWLAKNAHIFGFIMRYPKDGEAVTGYKYEPWHFRYVGEDAAAVIYQKDETLEEYLAARN